MDNVVAALFGSPLALVSSITLVAFVVLAWLWRPYVANTLTRVVYSWLVLGVAYYSAALAFRLVGFVPGGVLTQAMTTASAVLRLWLLTGLLYVLLVTKKQVGKWSSGKSP